jgi:hypothetical protein
MGKMEGDKYYNVDCHYVYIFMKLNVFYKFNVGIYDQFEKQFCFFTLNIISYMCGITLS